MLQGNAGLEHILLLGRSHVLGRHLLCVSVCCPRVLLFTLAAMAFTLPPLPYDYATLEPHIDARTMEIHHTKVTQSLTGSLL